MNKSVQVVKDSMERRDDAYISHKFKSEISSGKEAIIIKKLRKSLSDIITNLEIIDKITKTIENRVTKENI